MEIWRNSIYIYLNYKNLNLKTILKDVCVLKGHFWQHVKRHGSEVFQLARSKGTVLFGV